MQLTMGLIGDRKLIGQAWTNFIMVPISTCNPPKKCRRRSKTDARDYGEGIISAQPDHLRTAL